MTHSVNGGSEGNDGLWEGLGNPGWGWKGLFPYFKKVGFSEEEIIAEFIGGLQPLAE